MLSYRRRLSEQDQTSAPPQPFDAPPLTAFELDEDGRLKPHNLHALRFLGYQPNQDSPNLCDLVDDQQRVNTMRIIRAWQKGLNLPPVPHRLKRKDGTTIQTQLLGQPCLRAGRPVGVTVHVYAA